jgi:prepilin-type N-terminal cleavage/methylation domain-containing protein
MKTRPDPRRKVGGFTLVELLVVISIIVVLAAMTFAGINIALTRQKKVQTQTNATGLLQAIEGFYNQYSRLPEFGAQGDESRLEGQSGTELLTILLGKEELNNTTQNKKQIRFLNVDETKMKNKGGLLYSNGGAGAVPQGLYDAWGNAFYVKFDTDYDQEITDPLKSGNIVRNKVVIVYSYGPDGKTGGDFSKDDIKSW